MANPVHVHLDIHVNGAWFGLWTFKGKEKKGQPPVLKKETSTLLDEHSSAYNEWRLCYSTNQSIINNQKCRWNPPKLANIFICMIFVWLFSHYHNRHTFMFWIWVPYSAAQLDSSLPIGKAGLRGIACFSRSCQPCLCHRHRLPATKWQCSWPCFLQILNIDFCHTCQPCSWCHRHNGSAHGHVIATCKYQLLPHVPALFMTSQTHNARNKMAVLMAVFLQISNIDFFTN